MSASAIRDFEPALIAPRPGRPSHGGPGSRVPESGRTNHGIARSDCYLVAPGARRRRLGLFILISAALHGLLLLPYTHILSLPTVTPRAGANPILAARLQHRPPMPAPRPEAVNTSVSAATPPQHTTHQAQVHKRPATTPRVLTSTSTAAGTLTPNTPALTQRPASRPAAADHPARPAPAHNTPHRNEPPKPVHHAAAQSRTGTPAPATPVTSKHTAPTAATPQPDGAAVRAVLVRALRARFDYPYLARRNNWQGEVELGLRVSGDGRISQLRIVRSSGYGMLDRAALASARRIQSLPELVHLLYGQSMDLVLPVQYRLYDG